jgi:thiol-disulfide isomerase/thioredoxin
MTTMKIAKAILASVLLMFAAAGQDGRNQLSWTDIKGQTESLEQYKGKVVALNFWATWCIPCRHEMPMLAAMADKYGDQGLVVLGASVNDAKSQPEVQPFAQAGRISFPLLLGANSEQMQSLGLGESIPATAFFDADGKLVGRVLGELDKSELEHRVEWMLGKHHGKEPAALVNGFTKKAKSRPNNEPSIFTH